LRAAIAERTGANVGVLVSDTAGRAWREGQTDIAIGAAGIRVVDDHAGRTDAYGNELMVTAPAVADELAGAAELASGKLAGRPFAVIRGRPDLVLPADDDGPGAAALLRPAGADLFGLGSREAVLAALSGDAAQRRAFGSPAEVDELAGLLGELLAGAAHVTRTDDGLAVTSTDPRARWAAGVAAHAHGWESVEHASGVRLRPAAP
jgi:coenzyme F420-0:L-glutamate ligase/coenzyme F420-1:gamma-L-glutamate ligase